MQKYIFVNKHGDTHSVEFEIAYKKYADNFLEYLIAKAPDAGWEIIFWTAYQEK